MATKLHINEYRSQIDIRCTMALAAHRLMNGTAGGLPRRRLDSSEGSTFAGLSDAVLAFHKASWPGPQREG